MLHAGAELFGTLALGLTFDGSTEGVGHTEVEGECTILVVGIHLIVGSRDIQMEVIAEEVVGVESEAELPLEERVG